MSTSALDASITSGLDSIIPNLDVTPEVRENRVKWLRALWSGQFDQTQGTLCRAEVDLETMERSYSFCCLGVARKVLHGIAPDQIQRDRWLDREMLLGDHDLRLLRMTTGEQDEYAELNDSEMSFEDIALIAARRWEIRPEEYQT